MRLRLSNVGNPDYGQDPTKEVYGSPKEVWVFVESFKEASIRCREYIERYDLGGGNWDGGQIMADGIIAAHVAYNGTVWKGKEYVIGGKNVKILI